MFEAYRIGGPALPRDDVILAINSCGIFLLDSHYEVIVGFHFYDVIDVKADNRCSFTAHFSRSYCTQYDRFLAS